MRIRFIKKSEEAIFYFLFLLMSPTMRVTKKTIKKIQNNQMAIISAPAAIPPYPI